MASGTLSSADILLQHGTFLKYWKFFWDNENPGKVHEHGRILIIFDVEVGCL